MGNIKEHIKAYSSKLQKHFAGRCISTDENGCWNINIVFINNENRADETQFDIKPHNFDYGKGQCKDLEELWRGFCRENGLKQNSVTEIYIANL